MEPHPVEEPDPAHKGERHAGDNQQCFADAAERQDSSTKIIISVIGTISFSF